jgi:decaprenyl-phosphate phosphoribosyltransferase
MSDTRYSSGDREERQIASKFSGILRLLRPRQWIKNVFVFAALFFTPSLLNLESAPRVVAVFVVFCLASSGVYCFNDLRDREADRQHPVKKHRPLPSGEVSVGVAAVLAGLLVAGAILLAVLIAPTAANFVLIYIALNVFYSFVLKRFPIIDVLSISFGFVLRVYAGAAVLDITPTAWIQICAGLLALFIALAKRRDDLVKELGEEHRASLAGYSKPFLDACVVVTVTVLLVAYLIFTVDESAIRRLGSDKLFLTAPFVLAGLFRYLQLTIVYQRSGSPTDLLFQDGFLMATVSAWLAVFAYMIHF